MRQAIITKYLGPSNTRGSRIKATAKGHGSITVGYKCEDSPYLNHRDTARLLADNLGWLDNGSYLVMGDLSPSEYVFVVHK